MKQIYSCTLFYVITGTYLYCPRDSSISRFRKLFFDVAVKKSMKFDDMYTTSNMSIRERFPSQEGYLADIFRATRNGFRLTSLWQSISSGYRPGIHLLRESDSMPHLAENLYSATSI
jgi:hypothetical protein